MKAKRSMSEMTGMRRPDYSLIQSSSKNYNQKLKDALYYVHYEISSKDLKTETLRYIKRNRININLEKISELDPFYFSSIGKLCYIVNKGAEISDEWSMKITTKLIELESKTPDILESKKDIEEKQETITINKKIKNLENQNIAVDQVCDALERWVFEFINNNKNYPLENKDIKGLLISNKISKEMAKEVSKNFSHDYTSICLAINGDEYSKESYDGITLSSLKKIKTFYESLFSICDKVDNIGKKELSPIQKVKNVKYLNSDSDINLDSVHPKNIIGSSIVWVYNTKTRKLGRFIAKEGHKLDIENSLIVNYDDKLSTEKMILKKVIIKEYNADNIVKLFDGTKTIDVKLKPKLTPYHLILYITR